MYNEKPKMPKKKIIELSILLIILIWVVLFLIDYVRYSSSKPPLLSIKVVHEYTDGKTTEYLGLGYTYRLYERVSVSREEFVPFWKLMENPKVEDDLPQTHSGYNIPENPYRQDKYKGLLYYYVKKENVGTYKCINSTKDCNKSNGGHDEYDTLNKDVFRKREPYQIEFIYDQYAFVDDSVEQEPKYGDPNYQKTVYLLDVLNNKIIERYSDVKDSKYDEFTEKGIGDKNRYIVEEYKTKNWGIIHIDQTGIISQVKEFEYKSITYDEDTGYYIMCKDGKWFIYDLEKDEVVSNETEEPIYDVWINTNDTIYYKTGVDRTIGEESYTEFKIYRLDGTPFITNEGNVQAYTTNKFVMLISKDNYIRFVDYSGEEKKRVTLYFHSFKEDEFTLPCMKLIKTTENGMYINIYKNSQLGSEVIEEQINTKYWD